MRLVIVMMAFLLRALVPAGYMVAPEAGTGLVICDGHGPIVLAGERGDHQPPPVKPEAPPCAYSGMHFLTPNETRVDIAARIVWARPVALIFRADQAPGRGLAAPPPPATAPPHFFS